MPARKIIVVIGATGAQGGGLARAILGDSDSRFAVRAVTRDPESEKARRLAALGAEVVAADLDDPATLNKAFAGAYGAFLVTNFWEHFSPEREQSQARAMAEAARQCGIQHVIWSTLEDVRQFVPLADASMPTLMGNYKVPHFDGKGAADHVFTDLHLPTTLLRTSFYWENLIYFGMGPKPGPDGNLVLVLPMGDAKLPAIAAGDIGKCAYGLFKGGKRYIGKTVGIAGDQPTCAEMAAALSEALGRAVRYEPLSTDAYRKLGFPGAEDLGNMFQ
ncbi:MAG: NmrA/HSCARG family protein, partial [Gammaproteobacteria bacterium]|nr:NmrA/HSCARG family protein [Gammaproteobacteria bacterium]